MDDSRQKKNRFTGLIIVIIILGFLAIFTEKRFLLTPRFTVTKEKLENGRQIYLENCASCHAEGRGAAPRVGDTGYWQERLEKGVDTLIRHSVQGYEGDLGYMPPKGGNPHLTYDEIEAAVAYILSQSTE